MKIDLLFNVPLFSDDDLLVVWQSGSGRTCSVTGKVLRDGLLSKGFNPTAFVGATLDTTTETLTLTQQDGHEVKITPIISHLANHYVQELLNVPPLEPGKLWRVSQSGNDVEFYDLATLTITELADVPPIQPLGYLRGTPDGKNTEWIPSSGAKIGIQDNQTTLGDANTINLGYAIKALMKGETADIDFDPVMTAPLLFKTGGEVVFEGVNPGDNETVSFRFRQVQNNLYIEQQYGPGAIQHLVRINANADPANDAFHILVPLILTKAVYHGGAVLFGEWEMNVNNDHFEITVTDGSTTHKALSISKQGHVGISETLSFLSHRSNNRAGDIRYHRENCFYQFRWSWFL